MASANSRIRSTAEGEVLQVSVIIPTYNRADYLAQALRSVLNQTLPPLEVIVVDDGSTDSTTGVVQAFESRVRYYRQDHRGVSAARNLGLQVARGETISWLDADDLWESDFLATVVPLLEADPEVDGVYSGYVQVDSAGNLLPQSSNRIAPPSELFTALIEGDFVATPAIVVRKRCFEQVGGFDTRLGICEDYDMWLRLARTHRIVGLPLPLVRIRVHGDNTTGNTSEFCRSRLALTEKHFGKPEGNPQGWSTEKRRAHGRAHLAVALKLIQDGMPDRGWDHLREAVLIWPGLLAEDDFYYELACWDQPRGFRGDAESLDIEGNGIAMIERLNAMLTTDMSVSNTMRAMVFGNVFRTLATLSDSAGRWNLARKYLFQAVRANPRLLGSYSVLRRLLKLSAGKTLVDAWRMLRQPST